MNTPTKLISAEEWIGKLACFDRETPAHLMEKDVKQIQLNALRAAAEVCDSLADKQTTKNDYESGHYNAYLKAEQAILSLAERVEKGEALLDGKERRE